MTLWATLASVAALAAYHALAAPARGVPLDADPLWLAAASFLACCSLLAVTPSRVPLDARVRVVSTVHACVVSYLAWRALEELVGGRTWASALVLPVGAPAAERTRWWWAATGAAGEHGWATAATSVMAGYVAADISFALVLDASLLDAAMWVHHIIALTSFGSAAVFDFAAPYHALVAGTEVSTPFLNFYHTWARAGTARMVNGFVLWLTYLIFRVINISAVLAHVYSTSAAGGAKDVRAHAPMLLPFHVANLSLVFVLNIVWWWAITKILVRAVGALFCGWAVRPRRAKGA